MTEWKTLARTQQVRWKTVTQTLPAEAREGGLYFVKGKKAGPYSHCLPPAFAAHNLLASVREVALMRMQRFGIAWHGSTPGAGPNREPGPTTNLLSSQVQCINCLLGLEMEPSLLLNRLRSVEPDGRKLIPIRHPEPDSIEGLVAFEWIGWENYLGERVRGQRKRGRMVTSADALIVLERDDGGCTGVLIEWKFTESDDGPVRICSESGTSRCKIYKPHYEEENTPFIVENPEIESYFRQPHYQLLRLSLLAQAMLNAREHGVDRMVVLLVVPDANRTLLDCVPDELRAFGNTVGTVWEALLPGPQVRFIWHDSRPWVTATPELAERYGGLFAG